MKSIRIKQIDRSFKTALDMIVEDKEKYVKNPQIDFTRNRKLSMESTMREILSMGGASLPKEMLKFSNINQVDITPSAFIQQRAKIRPSAFKDLFYKFNNLCKDTKTYKGYKLLAVDGSTIACYRNPNSPNFMVTSQVPDGFNKIHLNALYDVLNKVYIDACLQPISQQDERDALNKMVDEREFDEKSIITADRGYESYNTFIHLQRKENLDFLIRIKQDKTALKIVSDLPMTALDVIVKGEFTTTQTNEDKIKGRIYIQTESKTGKINSPKSHIRKWDFDSPCSFSFRVIRFLLDTGEYETIVTSLSNKEFSASEIKKLYHMRWGIETSFRGLKYNVGLINLHSKKDEFVEQEIYAALTMYNYCSRIVSAVPIEKREKAKYCYAMNYSMAVSICKKFFRKQESDLKELIKNISKHTVPIRPGRKDKRNMQLKGFVGFTYRVAA